MYIATKYEKLCELPLTKTGKKTHYTSVAKSLLGNAPQLLQNFPATGRVPEKVTALTQAIHKTWPC